MVGRESVAKFQLLIQCPSMLSSRGGEPNVMRVVGMVIALVMPLGAVASTASGHSATAPPWASARKEVDGPFQQRKISLGRVRSGAWVEGQLLVRFGRRLAIRSARARARALGLRGARVVDSVGFGIDLVDLPKRMPVLRALRSAQAEPGVVHAEVNRLVRLRVVPNDPRFDDLWGLHNRGQSHPVADAGTSARGTADADIDAPEAWEQQSGAAGTTVAVLDSGVDTEHPDLDGNLFENPGEIGGNDQDDDGNGYVDDVHGYNFAGDNAVLVEHDRNVLGYDHGTHVAGIIAAEGDNNTGIAGVCFGCRIMVLKFFKPIDTDGDGQKDTMVGTLAAELEALAYARSNGADVVNGSFGSPIHSRFERRAFAALGRKGVPAVIAAGNQAADNDLLSRGSPDFPASFGLKNVISVAATNHHDHYAYGTGCARRAARFRCLFTNWGRDSVDVAAPGVDILSTTPTVGTPYSVFNGTSMAAPYVAGVAGLVKSEHPAWGASLIKNAIMNSSERRGTLRRLYDIPGGVRGRFTRTNGRVNASRALEGSTRPASGITDGSIAGALKLRRARRGEVRWPGDVNDVYRKRLRRGRRYKAALNGPRRADFDLTIYKPKTKDIWQLEAGCLRARGPCQILRLVATPAADESTIFRARRDGTYYFHVSAWYYNGGRYRLTVRRV
jgi:subtilisin family serine protease